MMADNPVGGGGGGGELNGRQPEHPARAGEIEIDDIDIPAGEGNGGGRVNNVLNNNDQNPLMNDLVLKTMFDLSKNRPQLLSSYRQICRRWHHLSSPLWAQAGPPISIKGFDRLYYFLEDSHLNPCLRNNPSRVGLNKYPKFVLEPLHDEEYNSQLFEIFWAKGGEWITHLTLKKFNFSDVVTFQQVVLCKHTPNLEYLDVEVNAVKGSAYIHQLPPFGAACDENRNLIELRIDAVGNPFNPLDPFPIDYKILLGQYPNLKHFWVGAHLAHQFKEVFRILKAIQQIRNEDNQKLVLKSFVWAFNENHKEYHIPLPKLETTSQEDNLVDSLRQARLTQLETFRYDFGERASDAFIPSLLSIHASTLRNLELYKFSVLVESPFLGIAHRPIMTSLKILTLSGYPVENLSFLKDLPSLSSLRLWGSLSDPCDYDHTLISNTAEPALEMEGVTFPSLTEFCCNYRVDWTSDNVVSLTGWLPNLTHLEMCLNDATFTLVCQHWPQLETLSVYEGGVGDKGIVGLTIVEGDQVTYTQPNITSLQRLKSFSIENLGIRCRLSDENFTQHSLTHGFLVLPQLQKLVIQADVNSEVEQLIKERIPFAKIITGTGVDMDALDMDRDAWRPFEFEPIIRPIPLIIE